MPRIFALNSVVKIYNRRICSCFRNPGVVDVKKKIVYGGKLSTATPEGSFGSVLFTRLLQQNRREQIFQVDAETGQEMKTREFLQAAVAVAEGLKEKGAEKGEFIFILGNNSPNLNIVLIGTLLIAAVPFPISYRTSIETFEFFLKTLKPRFLWCDRKVHYTFKRAVLEVGNMDPKNIFLLDQESDSNSVGLEEFTRGKGENYENFQPTEINNSREELALALNAIIWSEASEHIVGITHHNLNSVIARYDEMNSFRKLQDRVSLMVQKVFWISGLYPLFLSCSLGSKLIIMKKFRERKFLKYSERYKVNDVFLFSSKWWNVYKYESGRKYDLSNCHWAYSFNDAVPMALKKGLKDKYGLTLQPTYGMTEMTGLIFSTESDNENDQIVGKLFPELYAKVVSLKTSQTVGPGMHGEICIKGPTLSTGYLNNQRANLFDREGYLFTGFYGYYEEDGNFYVIDRVIHQIEYKEYKISPLDLEGVILGHPAVRDVCVSGISHRRHGEYPIAVVVLQKGRKLSPDVITSFVNERVPDHKKLRGGVIFATKIPRFRDTGAIKRHLFKNILSKYQMIDDVDSDKSEKEQENSVKKT